MKLTLIDEYIRQSQILSKQIGADASESQARQSVQTILASGPSEACILHVAELQKYLSPAESQLGRAFDSEDPAFLGDFCIKARLVQPFELLWFSHHEDGLGTRIRHLSFNKRSRVSDEILLLFLF